MALTDEMRRLTLHLGEDHNGRTAAVVGIRTAVARELSEFRADRQAEAEAQRQRLLVYMGDLDNQMAKARGDTATLLAGLVAVRGSMSREQQGKLAGDIGALRQSMSALLDEWNTVRRAMAQGQQERLSAHMDALDGWVVALRKDVTELRDRLEVAFNAVAKEQQQSLGRYMSDLLSQVDQLLKGTDQAMAAQHTALQNMANEQRQQLAKENLSLKEEVVLFRTQIGMERQQLSADQAGARQVWASYNNLMRQRGASKAQETLQVPASTAQEKKKRNRRTESPIRLAEPVAPELPIHVVELVTPELPTHMAEPTLPEPGSEDDLRAIQGVGPSMERRLHKAGIYHYAQLAAMTAENLRLAVVAEPFIKVEGWIEQARELAEQK